jgi:tRNA threonylcarbamoyladenosine biosynthesis protein TsaB
LHGVPQSTIFAIDTGGDRCVLALAQGARVDTLVGAPGHTHLEQVMPMVEALFARGGLPPQQCDAFAFASGPGSFTGLRVACTIAQGLALGAARPVVAVGHLDALVEVAAAALESEPVGRPRRALAAIDARMQQVYWCVYETAGRGWRKLVDPGVCDAAELTALVGRWRPDFCAGAASWLGRYIADRATRVVDAAVDGVTIARMAQARFAQKEFLPPEQAAPVYVRDRVAQTVAERREIRLERST